MPGKSTVGIGSGPEGQDAKEKARKRGPKTAIGKATAAMNALRHGVYSSVETLPFEDPEEYQAHVQSYMDEHRPVGPTETDIVREIAHVTWRRRWLKAAYIATVHEALWIDSDKLEVGRKDWLGESDIDILKTLLLPHEALESELDQIIHDFQAAMKIIREDVRPVKKPSLNALLRVASPRLKKDWEKHNGQIEREIKSEELPYELLDFITSNFMPQVLTRLNQFKDKKEIRSLVAGKALSPENTLGFERAESHLDRRLKTLLSMLFGLQDRRAKTT